MKVGDYVRTKDYGIRKISKFLSDLENDYIDCDDEFNRIIINRKDIIKSSPNIIDLIEVGDIIEFKALTTNIIDESISHISVTCHKEFKWVINDEMDLDAIKNSINNNTIELLSIVTKEQFEVMQYVIK